MNKSRRNKQFLKTTLFLAQKPRKTLNFTKKSKYKCLLRRFSQNNIMYEDFCVTDLCKLLMPIDKNGSAAFLFQLSQRVVNFTLTNRKKAIKLCHAMIKLTYLILTCVNLYFM